MSQSKGFKRRKPTPSREDPNEVAYDYHIEGGSDDYDEEEEEIKIQSSALNNFDTNISKTSDLITDDVLLQNTNLLLKSIGVNKYFTTFNKLNGSASSLFVHVYETVFQTELPYIQRPVDGRKLTREDYIRNCQIVIDSLRNLFLAEELTLGPEVTGEAVVMGSRPVIAQLVDTMSDLVREHYKVEPFASSLASSTTSKSTKEMENEYQEANNENLPIPPEYHQLKRSDSIKKDEPSKIASTFERMKINQKNSPESPMPSPAPISSIATTSKKRLNVKKISSTNNNKNTLRPPTQPSVKTNLKGLNNRGNKNIPFTPSVLKSSLNQQHRLLKSFLGSATVTRTPLSSINSTNRRSKKETQNMGTREKTEAVLLASIQEIADEEKRKRIRMLEKAKRENKIKAANLKHDQKLQEIKIAREKERLENSLKSERMKRTDKNLIEFSKVAKQALSVLHEIRRENEKIAKERKRELELGSKDNMERIESLYLKRLEMVKEMIEIRQNEEEQEFLSKKIMMDQVLKEVNHALDENIIKVKEEEEHNTGKADREQRELHMATMRILGGEDWNAVHRDRFLGQSYLPKVESAIEGYIRKGHEYHTTSSSSRNRKSLLVKKTTTKTTTKGKGRSMRG